LPAGPDKQIVSIGMKDWIKIKNPDTPVATRAIE
jgi:hypothetical protein